MPVGEFEILDLAYAPPFSGVHDPLLIAARPTANRAEGTESVKSPMRFGERWRRLSGFALAWRAGYGSGILTVRRVPAPGFDLMSSAPSTDAVRSCMLTRPTCACLCSGEPATVVLDGEYPRIAPVARR
jgi:hypothetical protein